MFQQAASGMPNFGPPPKISAAIHYIQFAEQIRNPPPGFDGLSAGARSERDLSRDEQRVYDAALECLRAYFRGEADYGEAVQPPRHSGDDPRQPLPVGK